MFVFHVSHGASLPTGKVTSVEGRKRLGHRSNAPLDLEEARFPSGDFRKTGPIGLPPLAELVRLGSSDQSRQGRALLTASSTPVITVVLPTFNGEAYVRESVESVLSQDTDDFQLIVCDDASTEDTWSIVESYRGPRCRLLRNEKNRGLFPTLNRLIREARSPWVHLF